MNIYIAHPESMYDDFRHTVHTHIRLSDNLAVTLCAAAYSSVRGRLVWTLRHG